MSFGLRCFVGFLGLSNTARTPNNLQKKITKYYLTLKRHQCLKAKQNSKTSPTRITISNKEEILRHQKYKLKEATNNNQRRSYKYKN